MSQRSLLEWHMHILGYQGLLQNRLAMSNGCMSSKIMRQQLVPV
jgi:hypothetical protein